MVKDNRLRYPKKIREITDYIILKIPLPKINPNIISGFSILTSLIFILTLKYSSVLAFAFIIITLLLDWFDGLIAKKYNLYSEEGYIVDAVSDRFSEGIMFVPFFVPWFYLFVLNNVLTIFSYVKSIHIILPLRFIFLIYFFLNFVL